MRIFLADLGHNQLTRSSDIYPLGVANLASYVSENLGSPVPVSLLREPEDFAGIGKFTRTMFARDFRRSIVRMRGAVDRDYSISS